MASAGKRKTSVTLGADALDAACELGVNVSAVADAALRRAVTEARRTRWREENAGDVPMVVVESGLLPPDPAVVVIPLLAGCLGVGPSREP